MQQIITEQIGMFCSGLSSKEYLDDLIYFLAMVIQINVTKRLPKAMERLPRYRRANGESRSFTIGLWRPMRANGDRTNRWTLSMNCWK